MNINSRSQDLEQWWARMGSKDLVIQGNTHTKFFVHRGKHLLETYIQKDQCQVFWLNKFFFFFFKEQTFGLGLFCRQPCCHWFQLTENYSSQKGPQKSSMWEIVLKQILENRQERGVGREYLRQWDPELQNMQGCVSCVLNWEVWLDHGSKDYYGTNLI